MTELDVYQPPAAVAVPVTAAMDSWITVCSDVIKVANVICDTPFVPDGLRGSGPAVAAAILAGRELSLGPMTSLANIHVIKGKPALSAVLMRALIQGQGHQWRDGDVTDTRAVVFGRRKGESEWAEVTFTADQARKAGIDLGKYPQDKLYARATSRLARRKFADVIAGMPYSAEELEDGAEPDAVPDVASNGHAPPPSAPRTARRRQPAAADPAPVSAAGSATGPGTTPPDAPAQTAPPASTGADLPPLPGEEDERPADDAPDDTDYDTRGTATRGKGGQLTAIWTVLSTVYGFGAEEKPQARKVCEHIIGRQLIGGTTGNLSYNEARTVLDTLATLQTVAESNSVSPREQLIALLAESGAEDA
jgi:hypothetical protein